MTRYWVKVTPRSTADRVEWAADGSLVVRVRAAPSDGAANQAVIRLLAEKLDVPRQRIAIVAGATGRRKLVEVEDA